MLQCIKMSELSLMLACLSIPRILLRHWHQIQNRFLLHPEALAIECDRKLKLESKNQNNLCFSQVNRCDLDSARLKMRANLVAGTEKSAVQVSMCAGACRPQSRLSHASIVDECRAPK